MQKHGRNTHVHAINGQRHAAEMPGRPLISQAEAMRAVGEVVYAVRVREAVKIGHTTDLAARVRMLKATEVLAFMPGTYADEQALHARLVDHLHHGREWYYPTPGVLTAVNEMRERLGLAPVA